MKTGLDHLPAGKRRELANVQTVLMEEFEKAIAPRLQPRAWQPVLDQRLDGIWPALCATAAGSNRISAGREG